MNGQDIPGRNRPGKEDVHEAEQHQVPILVELFHVHLHARRGPVPQTRPIPLAFALSHQVVMRSPLVVVPAPVPVVARDKATLQDAVHVSPIAPVPGYIRPLRVSGLHLFQHRPLDPEHEADNAVPLQCSRKHVKHLVAKVPLVLVLNASFTIVVLINVQNITKLARLSYLELATRVTQSRKILQCHLAKLVHHAIIEQRLAVSE